MYIQQKPKIMKKTLVFIGSLIGLAALIAFTPVGGESGNFKILTDVSSVEWKGKKVGGEHVGTIKLQEGALTVENGKITSGNITVNMGTIENKDLSGDMKAKLEGHLKSADFFDVSKFPEATFKITEVKSPAKSGGKHTVTGEITIKGKTEVISFPALIKLKDGKFAATGERTIDRSKFDVRYGSKTFFEDIGDKMIYDDFTLKFNIAGTKTK
jgi:polyisoprenoid-binding protein YceI